MATLGIIGAGKIGSSVARAVLAHGYDVVIPNSRGPETLAGKVVMDANSYYPRRDGGIPALDRNEFTTSGLFQAHLPAAPTDRRR